MKKINSGFIKAILGIVAAALMQAAPSVAHAQAPQLTADQKLFREIYQELVEINTTDSVGDTTQAARAMAARLKAAGFSDADMQIIVPAGAPKKGNLVARLKGTGAKKPLLLLAHIDVVEARREDWERDPFKLIEEGGYFYARGSVDDKAMASIFVSNLIRYRKESYKPERDLILALTEMAGRESLSIALGKVLDQSGYLQDLREERSEEGESRIENLAELVSAAR